MEFIEVLLIFRVVVDIFPGSILLLEQKNEHKFAIRARTVRMEEREWLRTIN